MNTPIPTRLTPAIHGQLCSACGRIQRAGLAAVELGHGAELAGLSLCHFCLRAGTDAVRAAMRQRSADLRAESRLLAQLAGQPFQLPTWAEVERWLRVAP